MVIDKEDFEVQKSNCFWVGRLSELPKDKAWEIAEEISDAITYATELKSDLLHRVMPSLFKERRLKLNLSMQDVTDVMDISKATISRIERGNDSFFDTVMKLDKFYTDNGA